MVSASLRALETGFASSLSTGFHHAHYASPGVFCLLNGLVLAALHVIDIGVEKAILILDCDYHYGNGTDNILGYFYGKPGIKIKHKSLGRKFKKRYQSKDYMREIQTIAKEVKANNYGFVIYNAGMDVLIGDPRGR